MMRKRFENKLAAATTENQVVKVVLDYVSTWRPEELASLPERCRPGRIRDAEDIADCAIELTRARIECGDPHPLLTEMESFFAHACTRLSHLERYGVDTTASDSTPAAG